MKHYVIFLALGLFALTSCDVQEVEFVKLNDVRIKKIENDKMHLDVNVELDNPNSFNIKVKDSDLDLYLSGKHIGKAELSKGFTIKKGTVDRYDMGIIAHGENLNAALMPVMLSAALSGKVETRIKGAVTGKVSFYTKEVPIDITESVQLINQAN